MNKLRTLLLAIQLVFIFSGYSLAQAPKTIDAPTIKVGDYWQWGAKNAFGFNQTTSDGVTQTVVEISDSIIKSKAVNGAGASLPNRSMNFDLASCAAALDHPSSNGAIRVCNTRFVFPLAIGQTNKITQWPYPNLKGFWTYACEAVAAERIDVFAGSFDTIKIECRGSWTNLAVPHTPEKSGTAEMSGPYLEVVWYAPEAKNIVRRVVESRRDYRHGKGQPSLYEEIQLIKYKVTHPDGRVASANVTG